MINLCFQRPLLGAFAAASSLPVALLLLAKSRRARGLLHLAFGSPRSRLWSAFAALKLVLVVLVCVALARPVVVYEERVPLRSYLDVYRYQANVSVPVQHVVLLDVSRSMTYPEGGCTRIELAKRVAEEYLRLLGSSDRAVVAVFAGRCELLYNGSPRGCIEAIKGVEAGALGRYTAIGDAIVWALGYTKASHTPTAIVVITDGAQNLGTDPVQAYLAANASGVPVAFIIVGSDPRAGSLMWRLRESGALVYTYERPLREVAESIARSAQGRVKLAALRARGEAYASVRRYDETPYATTLILAALVAVAVALEGA